MKVDLTQPILGFDGKPLSTINQESANAVAETAISVYEDIHGKGSAGPFIQAFNAKVKDRDLPSSIGIICRGFVIWYGQHAYVGLPFSRLALCFRWNYSRHLVPHHTHRPERKQYRIYTHNK